MLAVEKKATRQTIALFTLIVLSAALGALAQTAVNPMIPGLSAEFGVELGLMQWVTTGYILVLGISVPIATYLSRRVSVRVHIVIGFILFIVGCAVDAVAQTFPGLIAGRLLQATSVGVLMPLMQVVAVVGFPPNRRATAMGVGGIALGFAPNVGPTVGAAFETVFGWRSFFLFLVLVNVVLFVIAVLVVEKGEAASPHAKFDMTSFMFSSVGFGAVLIGVSNASSATNVLVQVLVPIVVGIVFVVLFVRRQAKVPEPLMHLEIFQSKQFNRGLIALVLHFSAFLGVALLIPLWVQNLCGGTSLDAGMVLLPAMVVALIVNPLAGILHDRFGLRPVVIAMSLFLLAGGGSRGSGYRNNPVFLDGALSGDSPSGHCGPHRSPPNVGSAGFEGASHFRRKLDVYSVPPGGIVHRCGSYGVPGNVPCDVGRSFGRSLSGGVRILGGLGARRGCLHAAIRSLMCDDAAFGRGTLVTVGASSAPHNGSVSVRHPYRYHGMLGASTREGRRWPCIR